MGKAQWATRALLNQSPNRCWGVSPGVRLILIFKHLYIKILHSQINNRTLNLYQSYVYNSFRLTSISPWLIYYRHWQYFIWYLLFPPNPNLTFFSLRFHYFYPSPDPHLSLTHPTQIFPYSIISPFTNNGALVVILYWR